MVAPERDRSGASNSLDARPSALASPDLQWLLSRQWHPDRLRPSRGHRDARPPSRHGCLRCQSRRQHGDDTVYSGTVAAATEGFLLGVPSIAVSLVSKSATDFTAAARVARDLAERFMHNLSASGAAQRQRARCRLRAPARHPRHPPGQAPQGRAGGAQRDAARRDGLGRCRGRCRRTRERAPTSMRWPTASVSVTPLQIDLTHTGLIAPVFDWFAAVSVRIRPGAGLARARCPA